MENKYRRFLRLNPKDKFWVLINYILIGSFINKFQKWYNFMGKYYFEDRSRGGNKLLIVVAGYKEYLWDIVFERIYKYVDDDIDVCICVPGIDDKRLRNISKNRKWSYLNTVENKLSLAQNLAIRLHKNAKYIYKLDEDIFIGKNYFKNIFNVYIKVSEDGIFNPGLIIPTLNLNGSTYLDFLKCIGKLDDYRNKFNELKSSCLNIKCHYDSSSAIYLWENSFPFDLTVKKFEDENKNNYKVVPHRVSIGAIFFDREFYNKLGAFRVAPAGFLGVGESDVCSFCMENSYPIILALNTFAGHFGFGPQNERMKKFFKENRERFL